MTHLPHCLSVVCCAALLLAAHQAHSQPTTFYVDTAGNDAWSGRRPERTPDRADGPFASVAQAQRAVRALRARGPLPGPVTVRIRGVHRLAAPIVFTPEDSGTKQCPVTYTAYERERPVLSGGRAITRWQKSDGALWTAHVPEAKTGSWHFRQLFVNGRRARRARSPNHGYFRVASLVDPKPGARWNEGVDKFRFHPGDIKPWPDLQNVEVVVFHSWNTCRVRIASVDEQSGIVTFTGRTQFRPLGWDPEQRYYVENTFDALDSPGEWFLDRLTGTLYYWPLPGEDMAAAEVVAPVLCELIQFKGEAEAGLFVEHVRVTGLSLQHADWALPDKGYGDPQAAVTVPAVVSGQGALLCAVERCEIAHVGTYGIWFSRGCKENRIVQNHIHDLGAGGVRIGEAAMAKHDVAESSRNLVSNNYIHDGGHVYAAGVGLWLAQSSHNVISHNEIHSFDYSGMSIGWNWNETPNRTHHNLIEHNHVHHVVRGVLSDGGGIYTLGTQTGAIIRNNVFHDVFPYMGRPAMAWGIYMDQGSNGLLIENNVVYNTLTGGIMNTGMRKNTIRNNVFAFSAWQAAWRWKSQGEPPSTFERNIIYLTQGGLFHADGGRNDFQSKWDHNVFWRTDDEELMFYEHTFDEWQAKGMDAHSLVADPQFVDAARYDFRLKPTSPALKLGIRSIDTSENGLCGPREWVRLPQSATFAATRLPSLPPPPAPVEVADDFESTPIAAPPKLAKLYVEGKGDSICVTDETAAGGKHSLKFTDAPGLEHLWNPHMFYVPHFRKGTAILSFDLRVEEGAIADHEWRSAGHPYAVGPSIRIGPDGTLTANGKPLLKAPLGEWFHVRIVCGLGRKAPRTYGLTLRMANREPQEFSQLACGSPKFRALEWLGFVSNANADAVFYLDNVGLHLEE